MASEISYPSLQGGCFCMRIRYSIYLNTNPLLSAYCHCTRCQRLFGAPFIHTIHLRPVTFEWTTAPTPISEVADEYVVFDVNHRFRCKTCGTPVAGWNETKQKWSVWGATLDRDTDGRIINWSFVKPTDHIFYGTRMVDVLDDLRKWDGYSNRSDEIITKLNDDE